MNAATQNFPRRIYLIGFSGSGKSTVGPRLAKAIDARFIDSDALIERRLGMTISELFARKGERRFRQLESEAVKQLSSARGRLVISLGGGAFANPTIRKLIITSGIVIYLSCSVAELYRRLKNNTDRPLLGGTRAEKLAQIKSLLKRRSKSYQLADIIISTSNKTEAATVRAILKTLKEKYGNDQSPVG